MVFFRRRGLPKNRKTKWGKYSIAYSGSPSSVAVAETNSSNYNMATSTATTVTYYDDLVFAADGTATASGQRTLSVAYNTYTNANGLDGKFLLQNGSFRYVLSDAATRALNSGTRVYYAYVYKQTYGAMTAATAKNFTTAGTYIGEVESEDENAYPDNGPLGTYFYIKQ